MKEPNKKPSNPNFSSGPCAKRPGWKLENLKNANTGRSHRSGEAKSKLKYVIEKSKTLSNLPNDYVVGIMPGSDTGALEAALWSLLGQRGVDILAWENFGKDWVQDVVKQLKLSNLNVHNVDYGDFPDVTNVNFQNDVIFTWNGTTSGVKVPHTDWIPENREGLTICDATSAIFAMPIDYKKCDVLTWSWQKVLGGEAAHGMIAMSPKAISRLENFSPEWPIPKVFRLANNKKVIKGIFEGSTINTPSMICVEDAIDGLNWAEDNGGLKFLLETSMKSFDTIYNWIEKTDWVTFLSNNQAREYLSNTSITFKICEEWYLLKNEEEKRLIVKEICNKLSNENVAYDINGYAKAPPSFRVWAGGTVEPKNIEMLLPWLEWAYQKVKETNA
ncbi:MAG: Phosphoserine aminotransferase [Alphaproteobacteria bacterium MarineAlpha5_Bin6]|nr:MAG: Phosphoserine aminotransferase [Alphaproteobacteria bacterium MarineAlpha5_Bin7]PPR53470.1 MAG: Phosphoserine aminotransferase [Alphaproteobacteria bacterium MarineAlpha5_Bin6]|tara:strand:- start:703 stop:1866 length:1164 start_codon:yes stop_codon:yes gene_type:complete